VCTWVRAKAKEAQQHGHQPQKHPNQGPVHVPVCPARCTCLGAVRGSIVPAPRETFIKCSNTRANTRGFPLFTDCHETYSGRGRLQGCWMTLWFSLNAPVHSHMHIHESSEPFVCTGSWALHGTTQSRLLCGWFCFCLQRCWTASTNTLTDLCLGCLGVVLEALH
jgi:hypothetical protein